MDEMRFDTLARSLAAGATRRGIAGALAALSLTGISGPLFTLTTAAKKKKRKKKKCKGTTRKCGKKCIAAMNCCSAADCGACENCQGGTCVPACAAGQECVDGQCRCATSCDGCCDGATCRAGNTSEVCGGDGELCASCTGNQACQNGRCCKAQGPCAPGSDHGCCTACLGMCSNDALPCTSDVGCLGGVCTNAVCM